jgi:hypothetical protein
MAPQRGECHVAQDEREADGGSLAASKAAVGGTRHQRSPEMEVGQVLTNCEQTQSINVNRFPNVRI